MGGETYQVYCVIKGYVDKESCTRWCWSSDAFWFRARGPEKTGGKAGGSRLSPLELQHASSF